MPVLDRDGVGIYYKARGHGPALLLSHGYAATCRMWDGQVAALAERWRVVTWDMRGHGRSDSPADPAAYSQALCVADLKALLDHLGIGQAVIGGLSLGGVMSLAFHLAYPGRVRALLLCDTGPGFRNAEAREEWNRRALARARALDEKGFAALGSSDEVRAQQHLSAAGLAHAARGMLTQEGDALINSLPGIAVPTLVLVGAEDKHFLGAAEYMARKIAGARHVVIPGAGHAANLHQPALFNRAVEDFLAGLPAEPA